MHTAVYADFCILLLFNQANLGIDKLMNSSKRLMNAWGEQWPALMERQQRAQQEAIEKAQALAAADQQ